LSARRPRQVQQASTGVSGVRPAFEKAAALHVVDDQARAPFADPQECGERVGCHRCAVQRSEDVSARPALVVESLIGQVGAQLLDNASFLAYLGAIERSPNTIKAYAHDLKDWWVYLDRRGLDWQRVDLEAMAGFVAWLRLPPPARSGAVAVLPTVEHYCTAASVNRKLAAVSAFYEFHARSGVVGRRSADLGGPDGAAPVGSHFLQAVPAAHRRRQAGADEEHQAQDRAQATPCADRRAGPDDPGRLRASA
jgi:hypothetical protein